MGELADQALRALEARVDVLSDQRFDVAERNLALFGPPSPPPPGPGTLGYRWQARQKELERIRVARDEQRKQQAEARDRLAREDWQRLRDAHTQTREFARALQELPDEEAALEEIDRRLTEHEAVGCAIRAERREKVARIEVMTECVERYTAATMPSPELPPEPEPLSPFKGHGGPAAW